jgi:hypothetical protein
MTTAATRPAPKPSVISRALRRAIQFCERMAQVADETQPHFKQSEAWQGEAAEYQKVLDKLEPKRKGVPK